MSFVRINISLPHELFEELARDVEPRKRSRFITEAIDRFLKERRAKKLAEDYKEAASEIRKINQELEGVISNGLD